MIKTPRFPSAHEVQHDREETPKKKLRLVKSRSKIIALALKRLVPKGTKT